MRGGLAIHIRSFTVPWRRFDSAIQQIAISSTCVEVSKSCVTTDMDLKINIENYSIDNYETL
jgi:hypothetical protein